MRQPPNSSRRQHRFRQANLRLLPQLPLRLKKSHDTRHLQQKPKRHKASRTTNHPHAHYNQQSSNPPDPQSSTLPLHRIQYVRQAYNLLTPSQRLTKAIYTVHNPQPQNSPNRKHSRPQGPHQPKHLWSRSHFNRLQRLNSSGAQAHKPQSSHQQGREAVAIEAFRSLPLTSESHR